MDAATLRLSSLTDWLAVPREARIAALTRCLDRIEEIDPAIQAWVDVAPQRSPDGGPLADIPVGVKAIIDTRDLLTTFGSPIYRGRRAADDAAIVRLLRGRGATILGTTQTAQFAYRTPAPTRNPHHPAHTPGGSSSGSAAAVAAGMVPLAIGTQTLGSILRPASYCGVTGFKPTFGVLPIAGVLPLAPSLDTLGFFTQTAADMRALWKCLGYGGAANHRDRPIGVPDPLPGVEPSMEAAFRDAIARLRGSGVTLTGIDVASPLAALAAAANTVMFYEGARIHRQRFTEHGDRLAELTALVRDGLAIADGEYAAARQAIADAKARFTAIYDSSPIIAVPAATGPAPHGLTWTGDARMNAPWTALGTPAIAIPIAATDGLPLGLQLTARAGDDARLLDVAVAVESMLAERNR